MPASATLPVAPHEPGVPTGPGGAPINTGDPTANSTIDWSIFSQILEMDEDENERDFSKPIVENYFEQAESTFAEMQQALEANDTENYMRLGHFLKGSSASLGLVKVQNTCAEIQHLDSTQTPQELLAQVREEYSEAHDILQRFFQK